jgi:hypothetical protein
MLFEVAITNPICRELRLLLTRILYRLKLLTSGDIEQERLSKTWRRSVLRNRRVDNDEEISGFTALHLTYKNNSTDSSLLLRWFLGWTVMSAFNLEIE